MFEIGIILKPHGIRGELRVLPTTDDPSRFALLSEVFVRENSGLAKYTPGRASDNSGKGDSPETLKKYTITSTRLQKNIVVLTLAEITDRNAAEALTGGVLVIPDKWALPLGTDEYYVRDLIGCVAVDEGGIVLGKVTDVLATGANDVYIIQPGDALPSFMVPAIKDVVLAVDMVERCITLRLMDGLRELHATAHTVKTPGIFHTARTINAPDTINNAHILNTPGTKRRHP